MIEILGIWIWVVKWFILCLLILVQSAAAQEGFISVQCCTEGSSLDNNAIIWESDFKWHPDRRNCRNISKPVVNYVGYNKVRTFRTCLKSGEWCYNLTTIKGEDYLIRGYFLFGDSLRQGSTSSFNVSIGTTIISRVKSSDDTEVEGIFRATNEYINFCLVKEEGDPYISLLELRNLRDSQYLDKEPSSVLKVVKRADVGNTEEAIRYPKDPNDRKWDPTDTPQGTSFSNSSTISALNANLTVPLQVLQTAQTHPERLEFLHSDLDKGDYSYYVFLYFLELNESVQARQRVFHIYINNESKHESFDIWANGSNYRNHVLSVRATGFLNLTLIKANGSELGPICNAYEILQVHPRVQETLQEDVNVIVEVRDELLEGNKESEELGVWSGDPCLPVGWPGVSCDSMNGTYVIKMLDLSSQKLQGSIPSSISKLKYLTELNLSNNEFSGNIPSFPNSSMLESMDLSNNELTGTVPESLASLPGLKSLYLRCNRHLSKEIPSTFNNTKINIDYEMCGGQESSHSRTKIVIGTIAGGSFLFTVAVLFVCFYKRNDMAWGKFDSKRYPGTKNAIFSMPSMDDIVVKSISIETFTFKYIEAATQNFKTLIGEGGFGSVYRGTLTDGQEVAMKVRSSTSTQGTREFENELNLLSKIRHENLVPLLGFCSENDQQILVYPFMSNGSLQDRLYGEAAKRKTLDWATRLSIALGAARGLTYLHSFATRCIIHRDVKSSNILLDHSMCAKVADFGFSKYAPQEGDSGVSLEVRGTAGYLDPEYYSTQKLSAKSDVFSFGVVLLEIVSGREPLNIQRPRNEWSLVEWAKPYIRESRIEEIVDRSIKGGYHAEAMWRVVEVALACIEPFSAYRPSMEDVVRELEDALIIENNASEYMKSIDSFGGSNRFSSIDKKIILPPTATPTETSTITSQTLTPPQPR